jgi:hypothetical protein
MPSTLRRAGWQDSITDSRLAQLTGTTYPAPPAGLYIGLLDGLPLSDGSDIASCEMAGLRVGPVTYGAPQTTPGNGTWPTQRFIQPTSGVSFTPPGQAGPGVHINPAAWGLYTAASGGVPIYVGSWAGGLMVGVATVLPASTFPVYAEADQQGR